MLAGSAMGQYEPGAKGRQHGNDGTLLIFHNASCRQVCRRPNPRDRRPGSNDKAGKNAL